MTNTNARESTTSELNSNEVEEDDGSRIKLQINALHQIYLRQKEGEDREEGKGGKVADVELTEKANLGVKVEDLGKEERTDQIELGTRLSLEREKWSIRSLRRAKKIGQLSSKEWDYLRVKKKQTKSDEASLLEREMKLTKAEKQTKSDNESLVIREMKLWQDKKDLCKERRKFEAAMVVERRELRKKKEEGARRLQQQVGKEKGFSRIGSHLAMCIALCKAPRNLNSVKLCFVAAFLFLFFLAVLLILMILLNLMPDLDNFLRFSSLKS